MTALAHHPFSAEFDWKKPLTSNGRAAPCVSDEVCVDED
jgi:hypothetical protein